MGTPTPITNFKDEIIKILSLDESELENYVCNKCDALNSKSLGKEFSLNEGEQDVTRGWVNQDSIYYKIYGNYIKFRYFKLSKKILKYKKYNIKHKKEAKKLLYLCTRGSSHYKQTFLYNNICKNKNMIHKYLTMYFKHKLW